LLLHELDNDDATLTTLIDNLKLSVDNVLQVFPLLPTFIPNIFQQNRFLGPGYETSIWNDA